MVIVRVPVTHPDAARLVEEVQDEYVTRYGGPDETPLEDDHFELPDGSFFVGYLDGVAVASGAWRVRPVPAGLTGTRAAEVKRMYVVPSARRRGLGREMLAHLERTAAGTGADLMVLETGLRQPEAIGLYASAGYGPAPAFGHYKDAPVSRYFARRLVR